MAASQEHGAALFLGLAAQPPYELPPPANRAGPKGRDEAFYQDVAVHYLEAFRTHPRSPIAHMAPQYPGYPKHNVRDWVARARQKGYLTEPGKGFPGGQPTAKLLRALKARGISPPGKGKRGKPSPRGG